MAAITVHGLGKRYGQVTAVREVSFTVDGPTVAGLLGPNGCGKTTTLRMLLGLVKPSTGTATIRGVPYRRLADPGRVVGAALTSEAFYPGRSARAHLRVQAARLGMPDRRVDEVLAATELLAAADRRVRTYSLGMRQRLALATALLADPQILILDEPTNGLDPPGIRWLRHLLRDLADQGRTVLLSSHLLSEVAHIADKAMVMSGGQLVAHDTVANLTATTASVIVRTTHAGELSRVLTAAGATVRLHGADRLAVTGVTASTVSSLAGEAGLPLTELGSSATDLEDVFLRLTGTAEAP